MENEFNFSDDLFEEFTESKQPEKRSVNCLTYVPKQCTDKVRLHLFVSRALFQLGGGGSLKYNCNAVLQIDGNSRQSSS